MGAGSGISTGGSAGDGVIAAPTPNVGRRADGRAPSLIVLHFTGMASAEAALDRLRDPASAVSAHYLIDDGGQLFALAAETDRAWHAGVAEWRGVTDVNSASIGIELANAGRAEEGGGPYHPFPEPQMARLERLLAALFGRWRLTADAVVGHSDVAPERKTDPGEKFDWARLAARGLAVGPPTAPVAGELDAPEELARRFASATRRIGYGAWRADAVLAAFRRRFAPWRLGLELDAADAAAAEAIADRRGGP